MTSNDQRKQFERLRERQKEVRLVRKIVLITASAIVALLLMAAISLYFYVNSALKPVDANATEEINVELPIGSSTDSIAQTLEDQDIIKNAKVFKYYTKFNNASGFQAGTYKLTQAMTFDEIIKSLKQGKVYREPEFKVTIPEGLTLDLIGQRIEKQTKYSAEDFTKLVNSDAFVKKMQEKYPDTVTKAVNGKEVRYPLEGYLYPSTYDFFEKDVPLEEIAEKMVAQTDSIVKAYSEQLTQQEMSVHEFLTFASLLEREATAQTDRETIASVFYNRLEDGMPLQTDPTVLYALGEHKTRVLYKDLEIDDPYNTYVNKGLTPGPIANAGQASLEATIKPAKTDYLYFVADEDGNNHFSKTYEEHQQKVQKYIK